MSLQTDIIFIKALKSNDELMAMLPVHDVYNTGIIQPEEGKDNVKIPYVLVSYDGMTNEADTKDDYEGDEDKVEISIEVAAKNREQLADLVMMVRDAIREYFSNADPEDDDYSLVPLDYTVSASRVMLDENKPCHWQTLSYQCDTNVD